MMIGLQLSGVVVLVNTSIQWLKRVPVFPAYVNLTGVDNDDK